LVEGFGPEPFEIFENTSSADDLWKEANPTAVADSQ
jgi:hypothetical protein